MVAITIFLSRTIACLVTFFLAVKTCSLELDITQGYFVVVALVAAYSICFEFARLRHADLLGPHLHCMLQLIVRALN